MKKVLVFPCGSEVGLEINRALANSTHFELYGGSSVLNHGAHVYKNYIGGLPDISGASCIEALNGIIDKYDIDFIFPAHDSAVLKFAQCAKKLHAIVITSPVETCEICRSKKKTYKALQDIVPTPKVYIEGEQLEFPLFVKPDVGQGSRGAYKVLNAREFEFYMERSDNPDLVVSEYLPGEEFTIDCFTNRKRELLFCEGRQRARVSNGISVHAIPAKDPEFRKIAEAINARLVFRGMWFFQVKRRHSGELVLMEVAPRIAGTMGLFRGAGVNFAQLSLFDALDIDVEVIKNDFYIENDRALYSSYFTDIEYKTIYIDFDDTIVVNGFINTEIIKLLYQAKNEKKQIILITRHGGDIIKTLESYCVNKNIFDEIYVIKDKQTPKSRYITTRDSIFIDDSFAERKEVYNALRIPVFAIDAIDVLLNRKN